MALLAGPSKRLLTNILPRTSATVLGECCPCREIHTRPRSHFDDSTDGIPPFLSQKALNTITEYQDGLLERLNPLVRDTPMHQQSVLQTMLSSAANKNDALIFNLASEALNTSYFLSKLTKNVDRTNLKQEERFRVNIEDEWGSVVQFKHAFSSSAQGMAGSGYLWMVMDDKGRLGIVGTYGAGTVLVQERQQRGGFSELPQTDTTWPSRPSPQSVEESDEDPVFSEDRRTLHDSRSSTIPPPPLFSSSHRPAAPSADTPILTPLTPLSRSLSISSTLRAPPEPAHRIKFPEREIHPLFAISLHEHAYLHDYGVWGKEAYLENFWKVLDWKAIGNVYEKLMPKDLKRPGTKRSDRQKEAEAYDRM